MSGQVCFEDRLRGDTFICHRDLAGLGESVLGLGRLCFVGWRSEFSWSTRWSPDFPEHVSAQVVSNVGHTDLGLCFGDLLLVLLATISGISPGR